MYHQLGRKVVNSVPENSLWDSICKLRRKSFWCVYIYAGQCLSASERFRSTALGYFSRFFAAEVRCRHALIPARSPFRNLLPSPLLPAARSVVFLCPLSILKARPRAEDKVNEVPSLRARSMAAFSPIFPSAAHVGFCPTQLLKVSLATNKSPTLKLGRVFKTFLLSIIQPRRPSNSPGKCWGKTRSDLAQHSRLAGVYVYELESANKFLTKPFRHFHFSIAIKTYANLFFNHSHYGTLHNSSSLQKFSYPSYCF